MNLTPGRRRSARVRPGQLPENIGKNRAIAYVYLDLKNVARHCRLRMSMLRTRWILGGGISFGGSLPLKHCGRGGHSICEDDTKVKDFTIEPLILSPIAAGQLIRSFRRHRVKLITERRRFYRSKDLLLCCRTRNR